MQVQFDMTLDEAVDGYTWALEQSRPVARAQQRGRLVGVVIGGFLGLLLAVPACEFILRTVREVLANDGVEFLPGDIDMLHPIRVIAVLAGITVVVIACFLTPRIGPRDPGAFQRRLIARGVRRSLLIRYELGKPVSQSIVLDDDCIHNSCQGMRVSYDWANLEAIRQREDDILICLRYGMYIFVPPHAFNSAEQQDEFVRLVENRLRLRQTAPTKHES